MHTLTITSDKPVVIIPLEEYESLLETIRLITENPNLAGELKKIKGDILKGKFTTLEDLKTKISVTQ